MSFRDNELINDAISTPLTNTIRTESPRGMGTPLDDISMRDITPKSPPRTSSALMSRGATMGNKTTMNARDGTVQSRKSRSSVSYPESVTPLSEEDDLLSDDDLFVDQTRTMGSRGERYNSTASKASLYGVNTPNSKMYNSLSPRSRGSMRSPVKPSSTNYTVDRYSRTSPGRYGTASATPAALYDTPGVRNTFDEISATFGAAPSRSSTALSRGTASMKRTAGALNSRLTRDNLINAVAAAGLTPIALSLGMAASRSNNMPSQKEFVSQSPAHAHEEFHELHNEGSHNYYVMNKSYNGTMYNVTDCPIDQLIRVIVINQRGDRYVCFFNRQEPIARVIAFVCSNHSTTNHFCCPTHICNGYPQESLTHQLDMTAGEVFVDNTHPESVLYLHCFREEIYNRFKNKI